MQARRRLSQFLVLLASATLAVAGAVSAPAAASGPSASSAETWASITPGRGLVTCGIQTDGTLWCWGSNAQGQLGDGTTQDRHNPVQVGSATTWATVAPGLSHTCATRSDGTAWCWGFNVSGQLGDGTTTQRLSPGRVGSASDWTAVATGSNHSCGLRNDGTAWCWGGGDFGKLGNGHHGRIFSDVPVRVKGGHSFESIDAGGTHTCAITTDGTAWCWGSNMSGQLGIGSKGRKNSKDVPTQVGGNSTWTTITGGSETTCGTRANGSAWCWGYNRFGQLGDGTRTMRTAPVAVDGPADWDTVVAGGVHSCGLRTDGTAWCWGNNTSGAVGDGTSTRRLVPVQVGAAENWTAVAAGGYTYGGHSCGLRGSGVAWCWGDNSNGQLGDGTTTDRHSPVRVTMAQRPVRVTMAQRPVRVTMGQSPWGPTHTFYDRRVSLELAQVTSSRGMTCTLFRTTPHGRPQVRTAVQLAGQPWGNTDIVSNGEVARPTLIAWGEGNVSVIWQTGAATDNYRFHVRTMGPDGQWGLPENLITAHYAYPAYQVAMNRDGALALAWANGDNRDRVALRDSAGNWTMLPPVPVVHPTYQGLQFISNPRDLFLDDSGRVTDVTWGTIGSSGRAVWMMSPTDEGTWARQRVAPLDGDHLGYGWVHHTRFAVNPEGDVGAVYFQQNLGTKVWSTYVRFQPAGGELGPPRLLSHLLCFIDGKTCGDVALAADGTASIAWAVPASGDNVTVRFMRRTPDGGFTTPQRVSAPMWTNAYDGVQVAGNARGDALLSFTGGDHQIIDSEFVRCPAELPCVSTLVRRSAPSWLDEWTTTMGPQGGSTVTWVAYYRSGVATRHLSPPTG